MQSPARVVDDLRRALSDAATVPLSCWNRDELAEWLCGLQGERARFDGLLCAAAAEAETAAVASLDGARSLRQFVAGRTNSHGGDVGADLTLGRWLADFHPITDALAAGQITRRHAHALRDLDNPRTRTDLNAAQGYLVAAATRCSWDGFITVCQQWIANADPDGELADDKIRNRRCSLKKGVDGTVSGGFVLDPVAGDAVKTAIEREALRLWRIDADPTNPDARQRNHTQRMADALVNLVTRGTIRPNGTVGAPLVHIVVGQDIIEEAICRNTARDAGEPPVGPDGQVLGDDLGVDPGDPLRRCELIDGTPIHPNQVLGLLGVATLRRLVLGASGEILDLGRGVRNFPRNLKDAMAAANRGRCADTGCDAPASWLEADHIIPWSRRGTTATANGQTLCGPANKTKRDHIDHPPEPHGNNGT